MNFEFIGWCHENGHDKIWALVEINHRAYATIWGKRGKKLSSKVFYEDKDNTLTMNSRIVEKLNKGYLEINKEKLDEVYPGFEEDVSMMAFLAACEV